MLTEMKHVIGEESTRADKFACVLCNNIKWVRGHQTFLDINKLPTQTHRYTHTFTCLALSVWGTFQWYFLDYYPLLLLANQALLPEDNSVKYW